MRNPVPLAALVLGASAFLFAHDSLGDTNHEHRQLFSVSPGQLLDIQLDTGGSLRIVAWNRDQVLVDTDWREETCPDALINASRSPQGVLLSSRYHPDSGDIHSCSMKVEIHVPSRFDVHVRSAGGGIEIVDVRGSFEGHTGGGSLALRGVRGSAELRTGGGEIRVRDSELDGHLATGGGHVSLQNVTGAITATSGSEPGVKRGRTRSQ